jgi:hypothetical protein
MSLQQWDAVKARLAKTIKLGAFVGAERYRSDVAELVAEIEALRGELLRAVMEADVEAGVARAERAERALKPFAKGGDGT